MTFLRMGLSMFNAAQIEAWASEYPDAPDVAALVADIETDKSLPQPGALPAGSQAAQIARARQQMLLIRAQGLGFKPPVREVAEELIVDHVKSLVPGADMLPSPEMPTVAAREQEKADKKREKSRDSCGLGFGFEL